MGKFPVIEVSGTPYDIGMQHGQMLASRIQRTIDYYSTIFSQTKTHIFEQASHFRSLINQTFPTYHEEMDGIAKGAEVDPLWIYALNARSEILTMFITECTAIYSPEHGLLAQNWDWGQPLEDLAVVMRITQSSDHQILMITEPGIIGKIGLNSSGLGVTINFLHATGQLTGIPIHIMLRALLDCTTFEQGRNLIEKHAGGQAGNIIFAAGDGDYVNVEFANSDHYLLGNGGTFVHTNHYLSTDSLNTHQDKLASSRARYQLASSLIGSSSPTLSDIQGILGDNSNDKLPICRPYIPNEETGSIGTICSLIMDLRNQVLYYTPGNPFEHGYKSCHIQK